MVAFLEAICTKRRERDRQISNFYKKILIFLWKRHLVPLREGVI